MEIGMQVRVRKSRTLPMLASKFMLMEGVITEIKEKWGYLLYRVQFPDGEAMYKEEDLEEVYDDDSD